MAWEDYRLGGELGKITCMNTTRNGKIAQLPMAVREELNRRLDDGESGPSLLAWLNALPVVQAMLDSRSWRPINPPNLTAWRQGGYRDWRADLEARKFAGPGEPAEKDLSRTRALLLASQCFGETKRVEEIGEGEKHWRMLRQLAADVTRLREMELSLGRPGSEKTSLSPLPAGNPTGVDPE